MKSKDTLIRILKVVPIILILMFVGFSLVCVFIQWMYGDSSKTRKIKVHYVCTIAFDEKVEEVLKEYTSPRLHGCSAESSQLCDYYLDEIMAVANLSDEEINEIKEKISSVPQDKYFYICVGKKLDAVRCSECGAYDGVYSMSDYNGVFIYWADEPLGNWVDGYI